VVVFVGIIHSPVPIMDEVHMVDFQVEIPHPMDPTYTMGNAIGPSGRSRNGRGQLWMELGKVTQDTSYMIASEFQKSTGIMTLSAQMISIQL
jgi:hypothetical protein